MCLHVCNAPFTSFANFPFCARHITRAFWIWDKLSPSLRQSGTQVKRQILVKHDNIYIKDKDCSAICSILPTVSIRIWVICLLPRSKIVSKQVISGAWQMRSTFLKEKKVCVSKSFASLAHLRLHRKVCKQIRKINISFEFCRWNYVRQLLTLKIVTWLCSSS